MQTKQEFLDHKMKGYRLEIVINADDGQSLGEALQAMIDDLGQGNLTHSSGTDEWFYGYELIGEEIKAWLTTSGHITHLLGLMPKAYWLPNK